MLHIPLYFRIQQTVIGQGFVADVRLLGRATCTAAFGSTWIYGVNPGALAEDGGDLKSAYASFRNRLAEVLVDLAEAAGGFVEFQERAQSFLEATDDESVAEWVEARRLVRAGKDPGVDSELNLRRETGELTPSCEIRNVSSAALSPALNRLTPDQRTRLAA